MLENAHYKTTLLMALLLLAAIPSCAVNKSETAAVPTPPPVQVSAPQPAPGALNTLAQTAMRSGVQACGARINQVTNFLTGGNYQGVGALLFIPPTDQDQRLISLSLEVPATAKVPAAYVSTSVAPNQANGCGGEYESVIYWNRPCDTVAAQNFGGLKRVGSLAKTLTVLDGGIWTKVFLMPAGTGCVSIKKEVVQ